MSLKVPLRGWNIKVTAFVLEYTVVHSVDVWDDTLDILMRGYGFSFMWPFNYTGDVKKFGILLCAKMDPISLKLS